MGTKSGSAIASIPSSGFALSNASGSNSFDQSRRGTSSSKSSNHFSEQEKSAFRPLYIGVFAPKIALKNRVFSTSLPLVQNSSRNRIFRHFPSQKFMFHVF
jgi:hypothetical protein